MALLPRTISSTAINRISLLPFSNYPSPKSILFPSSSSSKLPISTQPRKPESPKLAKNDKEEEFFMETMDCPVPMEQQPAYEYKNLSNSDFFSWAAEKGFGYYVRLVVTGGAFAILVGWPVARFGIREEGEVLRCGIGALSAGLLLDTLVVLRMYLGWAYVGNRLLSATVEYEESGWYDGQVWVKPPEVLARDRLLGSYEVKPVLNKVKLTLVSLGAMLAICAVLFVNLDNTHTSQDVGSRGVAGVYKDESARTFEPGAFSKEADLS